MAFTITLRRQDCQRSRSKFVLTKQLICHSQDSEEDALNADKNFKTNSLIENQLTLKQGQNSQNEIMSRNFFPSSAVQ